MESDVDVVCRKVDEKIVAASIEQAKQEFLLNAKQQVSTLNVRMLTDDHLPETSAGGVVVSAVGGRIQCNNSLESRLDLAAEVMLPAIRVMLFGIAPNRRFFD